MALRVLYICTGNVCRSPAAEFLLCDANTDSTVLSVSSAGLAAPDGREMHPGVVAELRRLGTPVRPHHSRPYEPVMAATADLVLTATMLQRDEIMATYPPAFRRVFTMREFARLSSPTDTGRATDVIAARAARRGLVRPVAVGEDDIPDPLSGETTVRIAVRQIVETIPAVTRLLPVPRRPSPHHRRPHPGLPSAS